MKNAKFFAGTVMVLMSLYMLFQALTTHLATNAMIAGIIFLVAGIATKDMDNLTDDIVGLVLNLIDWFMTASIPSISLFGISALTIAIVLSGLASISNSSDSALAK